MCDRTITLVHHVAERDTDAYTLTHIPSCSWYSKYRAAVTDKGLVAARETKVRIPALPPGAVMTKGDFLVLGAISSPITKPADLAGSDYMTILVIGDNRRGRNPHWAVSGS